MLPNTLAIFRLRSCFQYCVLGSLAVALVRHDDDDADFH